MSFLGLMGPNIEIEYEGKKYKLAPLSFKEVAEYVLWFKYKEVEEAEFATKNFSPELRQEILSETYKRCRDKIWETASGEKHNISWEMPEVQDSCLTIEGIAQQLYLSLKVNHPEVTKEMCSRIVSLETYSNTILDKLLEVNGMKPNPQTEHLGELNPS